MIKKNNGITDVSRPYEKCLRFGAASLTDAELLAVIIRTGVKGKDAVDLAKQVLGLCRGKSLGSLPNLSIPELTEVPGIGEIKAIELSCVGEISRRIASDRTRSSIKVTDPSSIAEYYMEQLRHEDQESILCMMLDVRNHVIGEERITRGTFSASPLSVRDLFLAAFRFRAVGIVLVHNHPSGDPSPSEDDVLITEKVFRAGLLLDIHLLDHIIIGDRAYVSFLESGLLD